MLGWVCLREALTTCAVRVSTSVLVQNHHSLTRRDPILLFPCKKHLHACVILILCLFTPILVTRRVDKLCLDAFISLEWMKALGWDLTSALRILHLQFQCLFSHLLHHSDLVVQVSVVSQ